MKKHFKRSFVMVLAVVFIALGLIGLFLPFLQGVLFLFIGILLISMYSPRVRTWLDRHTTKYPHLHKFVLRAEGWVVRVLGAPEN